MHTHARTHQATEVKAEGNGFHFSLMPVGQGAMAGQSFITAAQQGPMSPVGIHYVAAPPHSPTQPHPALFIKVSIYCLIMILKVCGIGAVALQRHHYFFEDKLHLLIQKAKSNLTSPLST